MMDKVDAVLTKWCPKILSGDGVCVPDNEEEMNWRLFFAHSQDMQGFRADIFTGGPNEGTNPSDPSYRGLRERWRDSKSLIQGLALLWDDSDAKQALILHSNPMRPAELKRQGIRPLMELLVGASGNAATRILAEAIASLRGHHISHATNGMIRSYIQNSALLTEHGSSFRGYLDRVCPIEPALGRDVLAAEQNWIKAVERDFYNVGPALSAYMICDWLLWLWREGRIEWLSGYKPDSVFLGTAHRRYGLPEDPEAFVQWCHDTRIREEWLPKEYSHLAGKLLPPRLVNEAIWLEENKSNVRPTDHVD